MLRTRISLILCAMCYVLAWMTWSIHYALFVVFLSWSAFFGWITILFFLRGKQITAKNRGAIEKDFKKVSEV